MRIPKYFEDVSFTLKQQKWAVFSDPINVALIKMFNMVDIDECAIVF